MKLNVEIETDKETLKRYNFKEEALILWDDHRHMAIPLSKVSGDALKKIISKWNLLPFSDLSL